MSRLASLLLSAASGAFAVLAAAGQASAADLDLAQVGERHRAFVDQVGDPTGAARIAQAGEQGVAELTQSGAGNVADWTQTLDGAAWIEGRQDGAVHMMQVAQSGAGGFAWLEQIGQGHALDLSQVGAAEADIRQDGAGHVSETLQIAEVAIDDDVRRGGRGDDDDDDDEDRDDDDDDRDDDDAEDHDWGEAETGRTLLVLEQVGVGHVSRVRQEGAAEARILQVGVEAFSDVIQIGGEAGAPNLARITQTGDGAMSALSQIGQGNRAEIRQSSPGAWSSVTQIGAGNVATVVQ